MLRERLLELHNMIKSSTCSIIKSIANLRENREISIDQNNNNRYRIVINERDGLKTAYYFSAPIYNIYSNKIVDLKFHTNNDIIYATGSNAKILIDDTIHMNNCLGHCSIHLNNKVEFVSEHELRYGNNNRIFPTLNGLAFFINSNNDLSINIEVDVPFMKTKYNGKFFALLREENKPFITVSCLGTLNNGDIVAPSKLTFNKIDDRKFHLEVSPCATNGDAVAFEINLYEHKLLHDTTVESCNPETKNAFGSVAFVGKTDECGEQWLYTKIDFSKLTDLADKKIHKAILHIPTYGGDKSKLIASCLLSRFCCFGMKWSNKITDFGMVTYSISNKHFHDIYITPFFTDMIVGFDGLVIQSESPCEQMTVLSTADSSYTPQILEITYG